MALAPFVVLITLLGGQAPPGSALNAPDPEARLEALRAIDRAGARDQVVAVATLAADPEDRVQLAAMETLLNLLLPERLSTRRRVALIVEVRGTAGPEGAYAAGMAPIVPVPPAVFGPLTHALGDLDAQVRNNAAYAIAVLAAPNPSAIPAPILATMATSLTTMLSAPEPAIRLAAARAAGRAFRAPSYEPIAQVRAVPQPLSDALIALMNQPSDEEHAAAMEALGLMREVRGVQAIVDRFAFYRAEGPQLLALTALEALARLAHPATADVVRSLASDKWSTRNDDVALTVAFARERVLRDGSIAAIQAAAERPATRARAEGYLYELRTKN